jgi:hypothetical protein
LRGFDKAKREYTGGASFQLFLVNIKRDALGTLSGDERIALSELLDPVKNAANPLPARQERAFVSLWKMSDLQTLLSGAKGNAMRGKKVYSDAQCFSCHRLALREEATVPI